MTTRSRIAVLVAIALLGVACSNVRKRNLDAGNDTGSASGAVDSSSVAPGAEDSAVVGGDQDGQATGRDIPASPDGGPGTQDGPLAGDDDALSSNGGDDDALSGDDSGGADLAGGSLCATGCRIAGGCYANGSSNPANVCLICDVKRSTTGWSANDGITCDDGLFCTVADKCSAGECKGFIRDCSDGVACNGLEFCDELSRQCVAGTSTCTGDTICESRTGRCVANCPGCAIGGTCYSDGQVNPANPCQKCSKAASTSTWSNNDGATCDDGLYCTVGDMCAEGICSGTARNCSDNIACNGDETCDESNDACVAGTPTCTTGQVCNAASGQCVVTSTTICPGCVIDGTCFGEGQPNPANPCQKCSRLIDSSAWSHNNGAMCDDGQFCTVGDVCAAGACTGTARSCADNIACNGAETCDESADACVAGTTTCTESEVCDVKTGGCVAISTCPGCAIDHACYGDGQVNPTNPCQKCTKATSPSAWSDNNGAACEDGLFCTKNDTCSGGHCAAGGSACDDGIACNGVETCDETHKLCVAGTSTCDNGQVCDVTTRQCTATCPGCLFDGNCYGLGQANPANPCQKCASDNRTVWSNNEGALCDDNLFCTVGDKCQPDGSCAGTDRSCDDNIACNGTDACDEPNKTCTHSGSTCGTGRVCDVGTGSCVTLTTCPGCLIDGTCYGVGQTRPGFPCQTCPSAGATGWSNKDNGTSCDDTVFCNGAERCSSGSCSAGSPPCGGGLTCVEAKRACFVVGVSMCSSAGNVVQYDSNGDEVAVQTCVPAANHGTCSSGACGCAAGYTGADCHSTTYVAYVKSSASGGATGVSWDDAVTTVQQGIDLAAEKAAIGGGGYVAYEVWVAAGTYTPGIIAADTIQLKAGVALYGGFAGTETARSQRNIASNVTILSGGNTNHHVVTGATGATIDGFTISGGNANGTDDASMGGGIFNKNVSPRVANCTFSNNAAIDGAGMGNSNSAPTVINCTFSGNAASNKGGGMANNGASPTVTNCTFSGNSASMGGGMANISTAPIVRNTIFWGNTASGPGPAISDESIGTPTVSYSLVQDGYASGTNMASGDPLLGTDLHLAAGSPAIDQGTGCGGVTSTDKDGHPRRDITGIGNATTGVDIGAYEYQGNAGDSDVTTLCH